MSGDGGEGVAHVRVTVGEREISEGEPKRSNACPVAKAVRKAYGKGVSSVWVDTQVILSFGHLKPLKHHKLSKTIRKWMTEFDSEEIVYPFSFVLS